MSELAPAPADSLHAELRALTARSCQCLVSAELARPYWRFGSQVMIRRGLGLEVRQR